ncbi:MAG: ZIP family metal transporter [Patescibacteria group bacterium]
MEHAINLILLGLVGGAFSLIGGLILILCGSRITTHVMTPLIAFASGAFLGVAFLDLLPEAIESLEDPHGVFVAFLIGISAFFALERFLMKYIRHHEAHSESHADHTESLPLLIIIGDSLHNFLDGIVIVFAYIANPAIGFTTALAVAAHEVPQEIGDFAILLDRGWSKIKVIAVNFFSSLMTLVGIGVGLLAASWFEYGLPYLLAGVAGIFTYISLSDLVPELHHRAKHHSFFRVVLSFLVGLILVGAIVTNMHE